MLSTSDLANRLNVSRQAVLKHYKINLAKIGKHSFKRKNRRMFDNIGTSIIIKSFKPNYENSNNVNHKASDNLSLQVYNLLKTQIDRKDQQIKHLGQQLNQAQILQQQTQKELDASQNQLKLTHQTKHHSWLWKLLH